MKKYLVYGHVVGTKYIGTVEAGNKTEAFEKANKTLVDNMYISLCQACSPQVSDLEVTTIEVEEEE